MLVRNWIVWYRVEENGGTWDLLEKEAKCGEHGSPLESHDTHFREAFIYCFRTIRNAFAQVYSGIGVQEWW